MLNKDWLIKFPSGHIYLIEYRKERKKFFFVEVRIPESAAYKQIIWAPSISLAHLFPTEQEVEEFKASYISPRKVSIIRLPVPDIIL